MRYSDDRFLALAQERGYISPDVARQLRKAGEAGTEGIPVGQILLQKGALSREQHDELVRELMSSLIPGYVLGKMIGKSMAGTIYLARKSLTGETVEVKILDDQGDETFPKRFSREAGVAMKLRHESIVRVLDVGKAGRVYYFVSEHVGGVTARELLERKRVLDEKTVLNILEAMAHALEAMEQARIVHRDIRPENIVLTESGRVKLKNLGLVKSTSEDAPALTMPGIVLGALDYISPEQGAGAARIDGRSDIYSLGATVYHLVTGVPPWKGVSPSVRASGKVPPPRSRNPAVSDGLNRMILKMMAGPPDLRYQTAAELLAEIRRLRSGTPPAAGRAPGASGVRGPATTRRGRGPVLSRVGVLWWMLAAVILGLGVGVLVMLVFMEKV